MRVYTFDELGHCTDNNCLYPEEECSMAKIKYVKVDDIKKLIEENHYLTNFDGFVIKVDVLLQELK
jgi:hypothetical protein